MLDLRLNLLLMRNYQGEDEPLCALVEAGGRGVAFMNNDPLYTTTTDVAG